MSNISLPEDWKFYSETGFSGIKNIQCQRNTRTAHEQGAMSGDQ